jgi:HAD superfamily hydrolase (TIGR01509 family)
MLLIFDCDGTLVDSELIALEVLSDMMGEFGSPMSVAACLEAFMGRHNDDILLEMERRLGRALPTGEGQRMRERMLTRMKTELQPVPGVAAVLEALAGPRCVASSSDLKRIAMTLDITGLSRFFGAHLFSAAQVAHGKPAPDLFLFAAHAMGFAPGDCLVIEDSVAGVEAGVAAGMPVIGFAGASHVDASHVDAGHAGKLRQAGARTVITAMTDLPHAIDTLRAAKAA